MTSRSITFFGFGVLLAMGLSWSVVTVRRPRLVTLPRLLGRIAEGRIARIVLVLAWAWVGWHLFARGSGAFE